MPAIDIPTLGTVLLGVVLVSAAYTFAVSTAAAAGRPHLLRSARFGTLATVALVLTAVFLLAYAFQSHDFRIRYIARYSDRSMSPIYLWTALWGGQDGSLLWWTLLLSGYIAGFTIWIGDRYRELQPVIWATLMSIVAFFVVLQLFAANPFATSFGTVPADGEGLNPLLQNYWMVIHPPCLYMGLTGWAVPFSIVVAALVTGRLGTEWIHAARKWVLLAWGFLSLGNMLGMFWSYEELGWGGYWAWDPVENASFLPWLTATAYLHSTMIQERRNSFRVWNVFLLCSTFVLTIFGTFLTRSGLIASVHSFARSDIGIYFAWYLVGLCLFVYALIGWRLPDLRGGKKIGALEVAIGTTLGIFVAVMLTMFDVVAEGWTRRIVVAASGAAFIGGLKAIEVVRLTMLKRAANNDQQPKAIEALLSREFAFLINNWILLGMAVFVILATTFPLITEALRGETVTVGPEYYNKWMVPLGLILLVLCGVGPLIAWRKATGKNLLLGFRAPVIVGAATFGLHLGLGSMLGFPAISAWDGHDMYDTWVGEALAAIYSIAPLASTTISGFVLATVVQEFWRGVAARRRSKGENIPVALFELVTRAQRRYGGYVVHAGVVVMFLGFTGAAYDVEEEMSLRPGQSLTIGDYEIRYDRVRLDDDGNKRMVFTDMTILEDGEEIGQVSPAKFVYHSHPEMPTTEVAIEVTPLHDLYVIMSAVDPETQRGTFRVVLRPLVVWIWLGGALLLFGVFIAIFPSLKEVFGPVTAGSRRRVGAAATSALLLFMLAMSGLSPPRAEAQADSSSTLHAGTVIIEDPDERRLFSRLLCECGDCQRLPLDTCGCSWAEGMRADLRGRMSRGDEVPAIVEDYRERFGSQAIAIPSDQGLDRALWAVPVAGIFLAAVGLVIRARSWAKAGAAQTDEAAAAASTDAAAHTAEYEDRLEEELRSLEGD